MTDTKEAIQAVAVERDDHGRFPKGTSGNPTGRPTGSRNKATVIREMLDDAALNEVAKEYKEVIWAMIRRAKEGDVNAAKFVKSIADIVNETDNKKGGKTVQVYIENFTLEEKPHE